LIKITAEGHKRLKLSMSPNSKLLGAVTFDLPPIETCPGRSTLCERLCYATEGNFRLPSVKRRRKKLLDFFLQHGEIPDIDPAANPVFVRFFASGDFYCEDLILAAQRFVRKYAYTPIVVFTRSWRVDKFAPQLQELGKMPNVQLWLSADEETGFPHSRWSRWSRVAYMAINNKAPIRRADLVFRAFDGNSSVTARKRVESPRLWLNGPVCPAQRGLKGMPKRCVACRNCFTERKKDDRADL